MHYYYAAITDGGCMTHRDTGYKIWMVMGLCDYSLLNLILTFKFCRWGTDQYMLWK